MHGAPRLLPFVDILNHHPTAGGIDVASHYDEAAGVDRNVWSKHVSGSSISAGSQVKWAYKASASAFDLLYLYGFVSKHPAHSVFPLAMEWSPARSHRQYSTQDVQETLLLLQSVAANDVKYLKSEGSRDILGLELTLRFSATVSDGILPSTMAYCRILAALNAYAFDFCFYRLLVDGAVPLQCSCGRSQMAAIGTKCTRSDFETNAGGHAMVEGIRK